MTPALRLSTRLPGYSPVRASCSRMRAADTAAATAGREARGCLKNQKSCLPQQESAFTALKILGIQQVFRGFLPCNRSILAGNTVFPLFQTSPTPRFFRHINRKWAFCRRCGPTDGRHSCNATTPRCNSQNPRRSSYYRGAAVCCGRLPPLRPFRWSRNMRFGQDS